jgi:hypothetical protein
MPHSSDDSLKLLPLPRAEKIRKVYHPPMLMLLEDREISAKTPNVAEGDNGVLDS